MGIRVKHNVLVQVSRDTAADNKQFYPSSNEVIIDTFDRQVNGSISVAATSSESIAFGDVTDVRGVLIEMSGDFLLRLNGGVEDISVKMAPSGSKAQVFLEADLSGIVIENEAATPITGVYCCWGDPTA